MGSARSPFEATSQPSSGPPKAADLRANPLTGKQWSEAQKAEEAQARRARHQAAITAAEQLLQRLQQASSLEGLAAAAGLKKTAAFFREDTFLTRQVSARALNPTPTPNPSSNPSPSPSPGPSPTPTPTPNPNPNPNPNQVSPPPPRVASWPSVVLTAPSTLES